MGNCVGGKSTKQTIVAVSTEELQLQTLATKNFKISHSDLVKQKKTPINDDYTFIETLGKGAFGEVKKAVHKTTGVTRAIKILMRDLHDTSQYEQILNEIKILKTLDHPHIMKIIEFYQDSTKLYLVSEYYEGGELFEKISKSNSFSEAQAANIMRQIFSVVNYCHKKKIVHRDIKPENIVYESKKPDAPLKMIDFGTSQFFRPGETLQKPLGTCYYVAPEVLKKKYTEKCDVWSCGVIMYFLLCGHPPFVAATEQGVLKKVARGLFEFKEDEWRGVSSDAMDLIRKVLEYSPEKRISAEEALNHPWFKQMNASKDSESKSIASKALKNLQSFRAGKKIQEAIWIFLVTYFSAKEETTQLLTSFQALDKDKNGVLSRNEIMEGYKNILGRAQNDAEIEEIINKIDHNNSGVVDYSEFVTATINKTTMLSKARLESSFKLFDQDGDGFLDIEELKEFLSPDHHKFKKHIGAQGEVVIQNEDRVWESLVKQVDTNNDGKISLMEFKDMMLEMIK